MFIGEISFGFVMEEDIERFRKVLEEAGYILEKSDDRATYEIHTKERS